MPKGVYVRVIPVWNKGKQFVDVTSRLTEIDANSKKEIIKNKSAAQYLKTDKNRKLKLAREVQRKYPERTMWHRAKKRAKQKNIPFAIEVKDIVIPSHCPIFPEINLKVNKGRGSHYNSPTLDRIVPELGYVKGNIRVISAKANMIKSNASPYEILRVAQFLIQEETEKLQ